MTGTSPPTRPAGVGSRSVGRLAGVCGDWAAAACRVPVELLGTYLPIYERRDSRPAARGR